MMITIEFLLTALVVVLIPGTGVLYTLATGLFVGRRASLFAALGCTLGIVPAMLASILGLAALFHTSALVFQLVKYAGVAYLVYLAWVMWRSAGPLSLQPEDSKVGFTSIMLRGFLINILNPKLSLFFLAFLPQFVPTHSAQPVMHMVTLGAVFMLMTLAVFVIYGVMAASFRDVVLRSEKLGTALQKVFAGGFAALGLKLAFAERN